MTDTTTTAAPAAPDAAPASPTTTAPATPAPRSDAEAAQQEAAKAATTTPATPEAKPGEQEQTEREKQERQRNRTRDYIDRINRENAELRRQLAEREQSKPSTTTPTTQGKPGSNATAQPGEPKIEDFNFDYSAFQRAHTDWAVEQALKSRDESTRQAENAKTQTERVAAYNTKAFEFADANPDFFEVVGSINPQLLPVELQQAIMGQENGPEIAYHLAKHEDDLWNLASIRAELLPAAVSRLASRLSAAQKAPDSTTPNAATAAPQHTPPPVSKAPPPAPTVTGRSPTDTPPEKLTDDEWYARERERQRKR